MWQLLQYLEKVGPDGIIVQDLGVAKIARENFPKLALHASTQMDIASAKGANFLSRLGFKRVVLARELSLEEIRAVGERTNIELEVFVHGALCASESGLCLFSSYLGGKSANRGACAQACRRLYASESESGYFFSPDDFELVQYVPELMEAGVASFKIEGRMKSAEYVGAVVAAYRHMIDNWKLDRERALAKAQAILLSDFRPPQDLLQHHGQSRLRLYQAGPGGRHGHPLGQGAGHPRTGARSASSSWIASTASPRATRFASTGATTRGRITAKVRAVREVPAGMLLRIDGEARQSDLVYLVQSGTGKRRYERVLPQGHRPLPQIPRATTSRPSPSIPRASKRNPDASAGKP